MIEVEQNLWEQAPLTEGVTPNIMQDIVPHTKSLGSQPLTFIDLFAGIGGFHFAMHNNGVKCVFASEWDKFARQTYEANFRTIEPELFAKGRFAGDINAVNLDDIPPFDILCAGFPCQPFSNAGLKKGFEDTRGTLFFRIAQIIKDKCDKGYPPQVIFLENVKGLAHHDKGHTLDVICSVLDELGYRVAYRVLNAKNFGVPQNRERIFIVSWRKENPVSTFHFPIGISADKKPIFNDDDLKDLVLKTRVGDILLHNVEGKYTLSERLYQGHLRRKEMHKQKGNGFGFSLFNADSPYTSTISARYYKDGSEILIEQQGKRPRKLHPIEAARLQGFPIGAHFHIVVSDTQAYKQFGNSVAVPMVQTIASQIIEQLLTSTTHE